MGLEAPLGATYGWRARIGCLQNGGIHENLPYEFYLMAPTGVTLVVTALVTTTVAEQGTAGPLSEFAFNADLRIVESSLGALLPRNPDVMTQIGIPPMVTQGWGYETVLRQRVAAMTPMPFTTDIGSCIQALQRLQLSKIALVSPFDDAMHERIVRYLAQAGIEVLACRSARQGNYADVTYVPLAHVYRTAKVLYQSLSGVQGVWITGAAMPSVGIIGALEGDLGVPVISSTQATMWAGFRLAGINDRITGYGRLLDLGVGS